MKRCAVLVSFLVLIAIVLAARGRAVSEEPEPAKEPARARVIRASDMPSYQSPDGKAAIKILVDPESSGARDATLGIGTFLPGSAVSLHEHKEETEILYVLEGKGEMEIEGTKVRIEAGTAVHIPPGAKHSFTNTSAATPVRIVQVYAKPGPEQRFKSWKRLEE